MSDRKLKALSTSKYVKYISVTKKHGKYDKISITVTNFYVTAKQQGNTYLPSTNNTKC